MSSGAVLLPHSFIISQVLSHEIGWEERLWNDLFCVDWDVTPLSQSFSVLHCFVIFYFPVQEVLIETKSKKKSEKEPVNPRFAGQWQLVAVARVRFLPVTVCWSLCPCDFSKTAAVSITRLDVKMFHHESWKPIYFRVIGQITRHHAGIAASMGRTFSHICLFVCLSTRKTVWAIKTKLGMHIL